MEGLKEIVVFDDKINIVGFFLNVTIAAKM
jgi:hypothetical protein